MVSETILLTVLKFSISSGFVAVVQLAISGGIGGYLIFSKEVKKAFK